jgi:N-acetylglucosaminyldiphosphoundecaprenol N-acetyl-beta-D-mannosaminyltransferase
MQPGCVRFNVLGTGVDAVDMGSACELISSAAQEGRKGYVCVTGVHGIIEARRAPALRAALKHAMCVVPDGMPLVWTGRGRGFRQTGRVYGPDLMLAVCRRSVSEGSTHFLYGGPESVAQKLKENLERMFPGIRVAGTFCPPFRPLSENESARLVEQVASVKPDYFWVGLSTPKQELFMAEYLPRLETKVMLGVGAAFDVHTGRMADAPPWVKRIGMQWLHRLCQEPRRLWRRYAVIVPSFLFLIALQGLGILKSPADD